MGSVSRMIGEWRNGDQDAYQSLVGRVFPCWVRMLDRRLGAGYQGLDDAEDVTLSVFRRLWLVVDEERPLADDLTDRASLLRLLAVLTDQRLREAWRRDFRQCRDARKTLREADLPSLDDTPSPIQQVPSAERPPETDAAFLDLLSYLLGLLTEKQQVIVRKKLSGFSTREIARELGRSERSIERQLSEIRDRWRAHPDVATLLQMRSYPFKHPPQ